MKPKARVTLGSISPDALSPRIKGYIASGDITGRRYKHRNTDWRACAGVRRDGLVRSDRKQTSV
ncbi:hypothetical protein RR48_02961 [Papilio machaon]|uniref:Uncharacterized protein n=1 Tax=Papilio machaon TaxID=76193 RepID=A0A0N1PHB9_PAPMA|nr:hypothetical protein RR48_02961 [Papilio machaon]